MRTVGWGVAAAIALLVGACTGDDGGAPSDGGRAGGDVEVPAGPVDGATVQPADGGVWLLGGTTGSGRERVANRVAVRYDRELRPTRAVRLPIPEDRFLFRASVVQPDGEPVVVGSLCEVPAGDEPVCGGPQQPIVVRLAGERAVEVPLRPSPDLGAGGTTVAGGVHDGRVLLVRGGAASGPGDGEEAPVRAWWVDPATGRTEPVDVPAAVRTPDAVCAAAGAVHAVVGGNGPGAAAVRVVAVGGPGGGTRRVAALDPPPLVEPALTLHCVGELLVVQVGSTPAQLTVVDPARGSVVGDPLATTGRAHVAVGPDGALVTTAERSDARRPSEQPSVAVAYHRVDAGAGFRPAGREDAEPGGQPIGVLVAGAVLDAGRLALDPRGG